MKFFLIVVTFIALTQNFGWTSPIGQQINVTRHICFESTGISPEDIYIFEHYDYPDNQDTFRYMRCIFENLQLWSETNGIRDERIGEILEDQRDRTHILNVVKECNEHSKTENTDVWLYNAVDCIANGNIGGVLGDILSEN